MGPLRTVFGLFKLRIGLVIAVTAVAGAAIQSGPSLTGLQLALLFVTVLMSAGAAGAFNQYYEADLDARMQRTRGRPFASGRFHRGPAWLAAIFALVGIATAASWMWLNSAAALYTLAGAFTYAIVYTVWLKRRTWWNIVIGGAAGSFAVLAGAAAVHPDLSAEAWLLAVVLFLWTPPHFWSLAMVCRDDYAAAGVPMLPVVKGDRVTAYAILGHAVALVLLSLALAWLRPGAIYVTCAAIGGAWFVYAALRLARNPARATALRCFLASLAQLSLLLLGAMADAVLLA
ncbi:MAG: heme o synthase [Gemmatimonadota bacterium]